MKILFARGKESFYSKEASGAAANLAAAAAAAAIAPATARALPPPKFSMYFTKHAVGE